MSEIIKAKARILHADSWIYEQSFVHIIMELDKAHEYQRVGARYYLNNKVDIAIIKRLSKVIGYDNERVDPKDLENKYLQVIVRKGEDSELELCAFGYAGADVFYLHNGDGMTYTLDETLERV